MKLVIVESPNKTAKISQFLGPGYKVLPSMGHVRDLPDSGGLHVLFADGRIRPKYETSAADRTVGKLKEAANAADEVLLATDPDREGEAISWHLTELLGPRHRYQRVTFHSITEEAVQKAVREPRAIDTNLVSAQQARRVIDRVVGWVVSPTCKKGTGDKNARSAGRVQSVALRLVVDREREIGEFKPQDYFVLKVNLEKPGSPPAFWAKLVKWGTKDIPKGVANPEDANKVAQRCRAGTWEVVSCESGIMTRRPPPPFTTASIQQACSVALNLTPEATMKILQSLFEAGAITYHRTDSCNLSPEAIAQARDYIAKNLDPAYLPAKANQFESKSANTQEAHEAIRPTHADEGRGSHGTDISGKVYDLIWERFIACQMSPERFHHTEILVSAAGGMAHFKAIGNQPDFDGWRKISRGDAASEETGKGNEDSGLMPQLDSGDQLTALDFRVDKTRTKPPPRFSQASLINKLEVDGIGRPSTFASILKLLLERKYVEDKDKRLYATATGMALIDFLVRAYGGNFIEPGFTATLEAELDRVARGDLPWEPLITTAATSLLHKAQAAGLDYNPLVGEEPRYSGSSAREVPSDLKPVPCRTCGAMIFLFKEGDKWQVLNQDQTPHWKSCTKKKR